jgi:hypothetical protein
LKEGFRLALDAIAGHIGQSYLACYRQLRASLEPLQQVPPP